MHLVAELPKMAQLVEVSLKQLLRITPQCLEILVEIIMFQKIAVRVLVQAAAVQVA